MNDLLKRLAKLPPEKRKLVLAKLEAQGLLEKKKTQATIPALARDEHDSFPVSFSQLRFWMMIQLGGGSHSPVMNVSLRFRGHLEPDLLIKTQNELMKRHESLRTVMIPDGVEPHMVVHDETPVPLKQVDLTHLPEEDREEQGYRAIEDEIGVRLDYTQPPLLKGLLVKLADDHHLYTVIVSHLVCDGYSLGVLSKDFITIATAFQQGRPSPLQPLPIHYVDYSHWQRSYLSGDQLKKHVAFWRERLQDTEPLDLPTDRRLTPGQPFLDHRLPVRIPLQALERYRTFAKEEDASLYIFVLTVLNVMLRRFSGQDSISVGSLIAGRNHEETQGLVGLFINTLVMRTGLEAGQTFRQAFQSTRTATLDAYAHQELPYEKIMEALQLKPDMNRPVLFRVMLVIQNMPLHMVTLPGLEVSSIPEPETGGFSNADISFVLSEGADGLTGTMIYNGNAFYEETAQSMLAQWETLMNNAVANPDQSIDHIPFDSEPNRLVLAQFNGEAEAETLPSIAQTVWEQAQRTPEETALVVRGQEITYQQLSERAAQTAVWLQEQGVKPAGVVALGLERSPQAIITMLGILMTGAAYLPMDPEMPRERRNHILEDSGARLLITDQESEHQGVHCIRPPGETALAGYTGREPTALAPEYPAYVIYTSGSTGKPKGVVIPNKALAAYSRAALDHFDITASDRVLQFASLSFDTAAEEIWPALSCGARLVLRDDEMLQTMEHFLDVCRQNGISVLDLPTAFWHALVDQLEELELPESLRVVILGGERATPERLAVWREAASDNITLYNSYGPTEATIVSTLCSLDPDWEPAETAPIGRPVAGVTNHVLNADLHPTDRGVPGELCIGGGNLAQGYLGKPALTAAGFVPDPFGSAGSRLYKTGDLVRHMADGSGGTVLQFMGRIDHQVKIRGYRVELGEIESALRDHDSVREAVVTTYEGASGIDARLAAYVTGADLTEGELRDHLRSRLPVYMVPSAFVVMDQLPLTASGKLNRKALPEPEPTRTEEDDEFVPPETEVEQIIAEIWQKVLGISQVGIFDDFFDLGGNSLLTTLVMHHIKKEFDVALTLHDFFEDPTIGHLAVRVEEILLEELEDEDDET